MGFWDWDSSSATPDPGPKRVGQCARAIDMSVCLSATNADDGTPTTTCKASQRPGCSCSLARSHARMIQMRHWALASPSQQVATAEGVQVLDLASGATPSLGLSGPQIPDRTGQGSSQLPAAGKDDLLSDLHSPPPVATSAGVKPALNPCRLSAVPAVRTTSLTTARHPPLHSASS